MVLKEKTVLAMQIQKVRISCSSNCHTKLLYTSVCERLWNFQPSTSDAYTAAFDFHRCKSHQARIEMLDARYQKSDIPLRNQHHIIETGFAYRN